MELNLDLRKQEQVMPNKTQKLIFPNVFSIMSQLLAHLLKNTLECVSWKIELYPTHETKKIQ